MAGTARTIRCRIGVTAVPRVVPTAYGRRDADTAERGLIDGIVRAGGAPVLLPVAPPEVACDQLAGLHGIVFSGGQDVDAETFGRHRHPASTWVDPDRDRHEIALWQAARADGLPVLAICRGMQLLCALEGGELVDHLAGHDSGERHLTERHPVALEDGVLRAALGGGPDRVAVNSLHHQAVHRPPSAWRVCGRADDGTIEAVEGSGDGWVLAVQWHPELMLDEPGGQPVFDALLAVARER